jgi:hypothetical protein
MDGPLPEPGPERNVRALSSLDAETRSLSGGIEKSCVDPSPNEGDDEEDEGQDGHQPDDRGHDVGPGEVNAWSCSVRCNAGN